MKPTVGLRTCNLEEDKIRPQMSQKLHHSCEIPEDAPLERISISLKRSQFYFKANRKYNCAGYESEDKKAVLAFDMTTGNCETVLKSNANIKSLGDTIFIGTTKCELEQTSKGWRYVPKR